MSIVYSWNVVRRKTWYLIQDVNLDSFLGPEKKNLHMCTVAVLQIWVWHLRFPKMPLALSLHRFYVSWGDDCICSIPIPWSQRLNVSHLLFCLWLQQPALILGIRAQQGDNRSLILWTPWLLRLMNHRGEEVTQRKCMGWGTWCCGGWKKNIRGVGRGK